MAYGHRAFNKIQISNPEDTVGTAEAAVEILFGQMTVRPHDKVFHTPDQDRGVLALRYETPFQVADEIELEMTGELYDRLAVFMFSNAVRGNVTPTQPDNVNEPNHYLWTFEPTLTAPNTPDQTNGIDTFTIEFGDNVQAYETEFLFTTQIEITGAPNEPCEFTWTMGGRQVTEVSFTGALVAPTAAYFPFNLSKYYIDTTYAGIGGTQVTGLLRAFTWSFETMFTARRAADGTMYFTGLSEDKKTCNLELTYYRDDTNSEGEFDKFQAQTTFYPRIELLSHTEMDASQNNPEYIRLDGAYKYTEWPEYDNEDGINVVTVNAEAFYDTTASKMISVLVGTTMSAFAT